MLFQRFDSQDLIFWSYAYCHTISERGKALGSPVLMPPRYRSKNQWLINTSHHKKASVSRWKFGGPAEKHIERALKHWKLLKIE